MKIDEAIEVMKNAFIECVENHTELNVVDANVVIQNALEELQWYKSQDLIRREDIMPVVKRHHYLLSDRINSTDYGMFTGGIEQIILEQIPKAEPPIDECTPNCEKRFTCKHCIQGMYCNNRTGNEDGTPCCCEPEV